MAHDVISLLLFIGVILLAFFRKVNVGVVALAVGAIAVRIFGLTDKQLIISQMAARVKPIKLSAPRHEKAESVMLSARRCDSVG